VSKFFRHGEVTVLEEDAPSRKVSLALVLPACVLQAAMPALLRAGELDSHEVRMPLAAWVPTVADAGFRSPDPSVCTEVNARVLRAAEEAVRAVAESAPHLVFPGDLLPALPLGVYVRCRLRCSVDRLAPFLQEGSPVAGVAELRFALAHEVASLLSRWGLLSEDGGPPKALGDGRRTSRRGRARGTP